MPKTKDRNKTNGYNDTIRFRCYKDLRVRVGRVAKTRGHGDTSDVAREGVIQFVEREEKRLGLPPLK